MKTIAFIPVRGGSKSIPLKNIKPFCDRPLVCWNIEALEACPADTCQKVKDISGIIILSRKGGEGCVREFAEKVVGL